MLPAASGGTISLPTMATATSEPTDPELEQAAWDLDALVDGAGDTGVERQLEEALTRAQSIAECYAGRLEELDGAGLAEVMHELGAIHDLIGRAGTYAALRFSTDTADPARGALLQRVQEQGTSIETKLLFFELEWAALSDDRARELVQGPELDFARHHLRNVRRYRDHLLSEPEEKILAEKSVTGSGAWARLFEELTSAIEVELPAEGEREGGGAGRAGGGGQAGGAQEADSTRRDGAGATQRVALDVALSRLALPARE